jgi:HEAT repeat protein
MGPGVAVMFALSFAVGLMVAEAHDRLAVSPEQVAAQVRRLTEAKDSKEREKGAGWLGHYRKALAVLAALPEVERAAAKDPSGEVRSRAVTAAGRIADANGSPCPRVVLDALQDEDTRLAAGLVLEELETPLSEADRRRVIEFVVAHNRPHRQNEVGLLAGPAVRSPEAIKVIRALTTDPDREVRHNAYCALFRVTDQLDEFVHHIMWVHAEWAEAPEPGPSASEDEKNAAIWLGMVNLGAARLLAEWTQNRPMELRAALLKVTRSEWPRIRRAAVRQFGRYAEALAEAPTAKPPARADEPDPFPGYDAKKQRAGMAAVVRDPAARARLKELAEKDPDDRVRNAADAALRKLAEIERE